MKELNKTVVKYPFGFTFEVKSIGNEIEETYFGRKIKRKKHNHNMGTIYKGETPVLFLDKFKNFKLDIFRFNEEYYILLKIDGKLKLFDFKSGRSRNINLNVDQFKSNGEDKIVFIIKKVIFLVTPKLNEEKILDFIMVDKYENFKLTNGKFLEIDWTHHDMFNTIFVESDTEVINSDIEKYDRYLVKILIKNNSLVEFKSKLHKGHFFTE